LGVDLVASWPRGDIFWGLGAPILCRKYSRGVRTISNTGQGINIRGQSIGYTVRTLCNPPKIGAPPLCLRPLWGTPTQRRAVRTNWSNHPHPQFKNRARSNTGLGSHSTHVYQQRAGSRREERTKQEERGFCAAAHKATDQVGS